MISQASPHPHAFSKLSAALLSSVQTTALTNLQLQPSPSSSPPHLYVTGQPAVKSAFNPTQSPGIVYHDKISISQHNSPRLRNPKSGRPQVRLPSSSNSNAVGHQPIPQFPPNIQTETTSPDPSESTASRARLSDGWSAKRVVHEPRPPSHGGKGPHLWECVTQESPGHPIIRYVTGPHTIHHCCKGGTAMWKQREVQLRNNLASMKYFF